MEREQGIDTATKRRTLKFVGVGLPLAIALGLSVFFFRQWWWSSRPVELAVGETESGILTVGEVADEASTSAVLGETEATAAAESEGEGSSNARALQDKYTFAVRNGAGISGLAARFSREITTQIAGATIIETSNAEETDYEETTLVSFIEDEGEAERVAELLEMPLGDLPEGELEPEADFLVIVGRDQG